MQSYGKRANILQECIFRIIHGGRDAISHGMERCLIRQRGYRGVYPHSTLSHSVDFQYHEVIVNERMISAKIQYVIHRPKRDPP